MKYSGLQRLIEVFPNYYYCFFMQSHFYLETLKRFMKSNQYLMTQTPKKNQEMF